MKKKILLVVLIAIATLKLNAQDVGQMWVGGTASFWSSKVKDTDNKTTSYSILPEVGYVMSEHFGIGISGGYSYEKDDSPYNRDIILTSTTKSYSVAPFVRYTFLKGDLGALFIDGGIQYAHNKINKHDIESYYINDIVRYYTVTQNYTSNSLRIGFSPGVAFNISSKVSLLGKFGFLGYEHTKNNSEKEYDNPRNPETKESKTNSFGFDFDMTNITLGAIVKF